jgi:hypothetical protein
MIINKCYRESVLLMHFLFNSWFGFLKPSNINWLLVHSNLSLRDRLISRRSRSGLIIIMSIHSIRHSNHRSRRVRYLLSKVIDNQRTLIIRMTHSHNRYMYRNNRMIIMHAIRCMMHHSRLMHNSLRYNRSHSIHMSLLHSSRWSHLIIHFINSWSRYYSIRVH